MSQMVTESRLARRLLLTKRRAVDLCRMAACLCRPVI
ncbi:Ms5788A family Cys-rich leader peptide [Micromonosporaceae bacterium Da 78-11]